MAKTRHTNTSPTPPSKKKAKEKEPPQEVNNAVPPIQHICRTCLEEIQASSLIPLNDSSSNIRNELRACIPEVDFDLVPNAGMCTYCLNALHVAYEFKQKCLQTEDKIRKQLHRKLLVDLTKLKKTNNMVQVSNGDGLGLDVVYINDPIEIIDGEVEAVNPFASPPKSQMSTPLLDEEIEMINSSVNIQNDDEMSASSNSVQEEIAPNRYLCNDDEVMDEDVQGVSETDSTNKKEESNLLLGLSESAPRKSSIKNTVVNKKKKMKDSTGTPIKSDEIKAAESDLPDTVVRVVKNKTPNGMFLCVTCEKSFENDVVYKIHVKEHTDRVYTCNGNACDFVSYHQLGFQKHISHCKARLLISNAVCKETTKVPAKQDESEYKCKTCKFTTLDRLIYKKHVRICSNTSIPSTAKQIKLQTQTSKILKHPKLNVKVKLKSKETLKKAFPQLKKIKKDTVASPKAEIVNAPTSDSFGDINDYTCSFCEYTVQDDSVAFEAHVTKVHKTEFPYACKDKNCHFRCRYKVGLVVHMPHHYGDRPYRCTICTYQCLNKGALQNHVKRHSFPVVRPKKWNRTYF